MNGNDDPPAEADSTEELNELLAPLKEIRPSLETKQVLRLAVATELARLSDREYRRRLPWWKRSISVPVPVALGVCVAGLVLLAAQWRTPYATVAIEGERQKSLQSTSESGLVKSTGFESKTASDAPMVEYYATETYLCGVGRLSSTSVYTFREQ